MSLTLLLDLDDTLLVNDIREFLPKYLKAFAVFAADVLPPDRFISSLMAATDRMMANRRPDCTLREIFEEAFYPAVRLSPAAFEPLAERFYREVFPSLQPLTRPNPATAGLIDQAMQRGYGLVVATDPLFPRTAIEQRLAWAGLPPQEYPFLVVPSYESMHFSKSDPAYYAEILSSAGWPEGPIVMVGDALDRDIRPAQLMGLPAYWVSGQSETIDGGPPRGSGGLGELLAWIDSIPPEKLIPNGTYPAAMLANLRSTPAVLDSLCRDLPPTTWAFHPLEGEWCLNEILCHLRDVETQVNLPRLHQLLKEVNPFMPGMDTDAWAVERNYHDQDGQKALRSFMAARMEMLDILESLPEETWQRVARHAIFGPTTLAELIGFTTSHDRLHVQQAQRTLQG